MADSLRLSVLDQSPVSEGMAGGQALRNTIDLAQLADAFGYDHESRRRSYELVADAFGLAGARETAGAAASRR